MRIRFIARLSSFASHLIGILFLLFGFAPAYAAQDLELSFSVEFEHENHLQNGDPQYVPANQNPNNNSMGSGVAYWPGQNSYLLLDNNPKRLLEFTLNHAFVRSILLTNFHDPEDIHWIHDNTFVIAQEYNTGSSSQNELIVIDMPTTGDKVNYVNRIQQIRFPSISNSQNLGIEAVTMIGQDFYFTTEKAPPSPAWQVWRTSTNSSGNVTPTPMFALPGSLTLNDVSGMATDGLYLWMLSHQGAGTVSAPLPRLIKYTTNGTVVADYSLPTWPVTGVWKQAEGVEVFVNSSARTLNIFLTGESGQAEGGFGVDFAHYDADLFEISSQPQSLIVNAGSSAVFSISVGGVGPFTYQWRKNGVNISGATASSYIIPATAGTDAATYDVVVTSYGVSITSAAAQLAVVTTQPLNRIVSGGNVTFTVAVTGTGPFTYQWQKDNSPISGATSSSYVVSSVNGSKAGSYNVVISKSDVSGTSQSACLHVVTQVPLAQQVNAGSSAQFQVNVAGTCGALIYQWRKMPSTILTDVSPYSGTATPTLTISSVTSSETGPYRVYLTDGPATWNNTTVYLTLNTPPSITTHPRGKSVNPGNAASFTVAASGTAPFTYQWRKNGVNLSDGGSAPAISGATTPTLTLGNISTGDAGNYSCVVNNITAIPATSSDAALSVVPASAVGVVSSSLGTSSIGAISTHIEQPDGKILVGGSFGVIRLLADGTVDSTFTSGIPSGAGSANTLALAPNGSIYVGGGFAWYDYDEWGNQTTYYNNNLMRLNSDGSIDGNFWPQPDEGVHALAIQTDGDIIAGGDFLGFNGYYPTRRISRLAASYGYVDTSFHAQNVGFDGLVRSLLIQPDGKILVGGDFNYFDDGYYSGNTQSRIARLHSNGSLDSAYYAIPLNASLFSMAFQADGRLLVGGTMTELYYAAGSRNGIARITTNTPYANAILDTSFNPGTGATGGGVHGIIANQAAFVATGSLGTPRTDHAAVRLANGKVLVMGGWSITQGTLSSAELYDPATGTWSAAGSMSDARQRPTATLLANGKVLVAGGSGLATAELYDPSNGSWSTTDSMDEGRIWHTATLLPNGKVLVAGGSTGMGFEFDGAEIYDPSTGMWTATTDMNGSRCLHTATLLANGKVLVTGGFISSSPYVLATAEIYNPVNQTWTPADSMNQDRIHHAATLLANGSVLVCSGTTSELYNPSLDSWTASGDLNLSRSEEPGVLLPNGRFLLVGGNSSQSVPTAEQYDPATGLWYTDGNLITPRQGHTSTVLADGRVLIAGGSDEDADNVYASSELYEPNSRTYIAGGFTAVDTVTRKGFARLKQDGTLDAFVNPGAGIGGTTPAIYAITRSRDGTFIISGNFTSFNGTTRHGIARLTVP